MSVALRSNRALQEALAAAREQLTSELDGVDRMREYAERELGEGDVIPAQVAKSSKSRSRRHKPSSGSPEAVQKRCDAVDDLLAERRDDLSAAQIAKELGLTIETVRTALTRLRKQKLAKLVKKGRTTRYRTLRPPARDEGGTVEGRFAEIVRERTFASHEELSQALGVSYERVAEIGGAFVAEGEVEMDHRNGRAVYVIPPRRS
jgi:DNA-binding transcriptional ArsR family regulator